MLHIFLIIFIIACTASMFLYSEPLGVSNEHLWYCVCYQYYHVSWLHLLLNMFAIGYMHPAICKIWERRFNDTAHTSQKLFIVGYLASVIAGAFCAGNIPTIGASGIVFFLLGVLLLLNPTLKQLQNYMWIAAAVATQIYFGGTNTSLHITCFVFGALYTIVHEFLKQYKSNVNRGIYQY